MARKLFTVSITFPVDDWVENHQWDIVGIFNREPDVVEYVLAPNPRTRILEFHSLRARTVAHRVAELVCLDIEGLTFTIRRE